MGTVDTIQESAFKDTGNSIEAAIKTPTIRSVLVQKQNAIQAALNEVNDAIQALDENPELEKFHDALTRALGSRRF